MIFIEICDRNFKKSAEVDRNHFTTVGGEPDATDADGQRNCKTFFSTNLVHFATFEIEDCKKFKCTLANFFGDSTPRSALLYEVGRAWHERSVAKSLKHKVMEERKGEREKERKRERRSGGSQQ